MKNILSLFICIIVSSTLLHAQKFMTRTGQVTFFSTTLVEDIEAVNNEVGAVLDVEKNTVAFQMPIRSFRFEKALMQEHFNDNYLESDTYPKATFEGKFASIFDTKKTGNQTATVKGKLTIHGITRQVEIPGTISVNGKEITLDSKFMVSPDDYKIKIPSMVKSKIAEQIEVTVKTILKKI